MVVVILVAVGVPGVAVVVAVIVQSRLISLMRIEQEQTCSSHGQCTQCCREGRVLQVVCIEALCIVGSVQEKAYHEQSVERVTTAHASIALLEFAHLLS